MPLVRSDGLPTQHMRALAYWSAAPKLDDFISLQVCGNEWVSHVTCRRKLIDELGVITATATAAPRAAARRPTTSSTAWSPATTHSITPARRGAADRRPRRLAGGGDRGRPRAGGEVGAPPAGRAAAGADRARLLPPAADLQAGRLRAGEAAARRRRAASAGTWRGRRPTTPPPRSSGERAAEDPDYRFAVVQSELYRRHLRSSVEGLDVIPLARYLSHFARWYREDERAPEVERVARTVLDQGVRGPRTGGGLR